MAKNFKQKGERITITASGSDISAGDVVRLNDMACVALEDIPDGSSGAAATVGVWEVPKKTGVTIAAGENAYLFEDDLKATNEATSGVLVGKFWADAGSAVTTAEVKWGV